MHAASKCLKIQLIKLVRNCRAYRGINSEVFQTGSEAVGIEVFSKDLSLLV